MPDKAKRDSIFVGSLEIEGFMMPDGTYRMSQTQAALRAHHRTLWRIEAVAQVLAEKPERKPGTW